MHTHMHTYRERALPDHIYTHMYAHTHASDPELYIHTRTRALPAAASSGRHVFFYIWQLLPAGLQIQRNTAALSAALFLHSDYHLDREPQRWSLPGSAAPNYV